MHHSKWAICALLLFVSTSIQADSPPSTLEVRLLRVEGAAAGVRRSAERLSDIAKKISDSKSLSDLPQLRNELVELRRMVVGARMAGQIAIQEMSDKSGTD